MGFLAPLFGAIGGGLASAATAAVPALVGTALQRIGGGGSSTQTVRNSVDYQAMVREAEAAGFNPLTVLRNGGSAGFAVQTMPAVASSSTLGNALGDAFFAGVEAYSPIRKADTKQQKQLMMDQVRSWDKSPLSRQAVAQPPTARAAPKEDWRVPPFVMPFVGKDDAELMRTGGPAQDVEGFDELGRPVDEAGNLIIRDIVPAFGFPWGVDASRTPMEQVEAEYGEAGELVFGVARMGEDYFRNSMNATSWARYASPEREALRADRQYRDATSSSGWIRRTPDQWRDQRTRINRGPRPWDR